MIDVMRSEWTKMRSVRSTVWTLGAAGGLMLVVGVLGSLAVVSMQGGSGSYDQVSVSLAGLPFGALALATLGVIVISGEYRTGAIRVTLAAVPDRLRFLAAKTVVFTVVALVVGTAASFAAFLAGQAVFAGEGAAASLADPEVLRAVFGGGLYLTASGLLGLACGALIRHTPGAIVTVIALIMVLPVLAAVLTGETGRRIQEYVTSNAGSQITKVHPTGLAPWTGLAVYLLWVAVPFVVAAVLLRRRDA
ncbi:ABC transporter permease [Streptosporangium carneum]|uniref:ABC transporter permease n=1 Tax=Streptosporangium carneum TaxID=47481 RepID=A0A9W6HW51_9ACTN|nr:ABC transporter permease [Streptosporangium carneum]GLK06668.1 ABC transporter permease [Streptosporangium carneum]